MSTKTTKSMDINTPLIIILGSMVIRLIGLGNPLGQKTTTSMAPQLRYLLRINLKQITYLSLSIKSKDMAAISSTMKAF